MFGAKGRESSCNCQRQHKPALLQQTTTPASYTDSSTGQTRHRRRRRRRREGVGQRGEIKVESIVFFRKKVQDEDPPVSLLFRAHIPRPRHHVCPQRRQRIPFLPLQMPQELQDEAQPPQAQMDQSLPQVRRQRDGRRQHAHLLRAPPRAHPLLARPRRKDPHGHAARRGDTRPPRARLLPLPHGGQQAARARRKPEAGGREPAPAAQGPADGCCRCCCC